MSKLEGFLVTLSRVAFLLRDGVNDDRKTSSQKEELIKLSLELDDIYLYIDNVAKTSGLLAALVGELGGDTEEYEEDK